MKFILKNRHLASNMASRRLQNLLPDFPMVSLVKFVNATVISAKVHLWCCTEFCLSLAQPPPLQHNGQGNCKLES